MFLLSTQPSSDRFQDPQSGRWHRNKHNCTSLRLPEEFCALVFGPVTFSRTTIYFLCLRFSLNSFYKRFFILPQVCCLFVWDARLGIHHELSWRGRGAAGCGRGHRHQVTPRCVARPPLPRAELLGWCAPAPALAPSPAQLQTGISVGSDSSPCPFSVMGELPMDGWFLGVLWVLLNFLWRVRENFWVNTGENAISISHCIDGVF